MAIKNENKGGQGLKKFWSEFNTQSQDGLPALSTALETEKVPQHCVAEIKTGLPTHISNKTRVVTARREKGEVKVPVPVVAIVAFIAGFLVAVTAVKFSAVARDVLV